jgi:putative ABC transport system substrate-binding protein
MNTIPGMPCINHDQQTSKASNDPGIYFSRDWAVAGGLMSYGPPATDQGRQAGIYVGRILKGEKPVNLPVARSIRLEFVINLATARAIGIEVPVKLLSISDEVIE